MSSVSTDNRIIVGLGGKKFSGKDTFAEFMQESLTQRGIDSVILNMSDPLEKIIEIINPHIIADPDTILLGYLIPERGQPYNSITRQLKFLHNDISRKDLYAAMKTLPMVRQFLQKIGTEVGREIIHEDVWVDYAKKSIAEQHKLGKVVFITGIRFLNEIQMVTDLGGETAYVERNVEFTETSTDLHSSELSVSIQDFDYLIHNNKELEDLRNYAESYVKALLRENGVEP